MPCNLIRNLQHFGQFIALTASTKVLGPNASDKSFGVAFNKPFLSHVRELITWAADTISYMHVLVGRNNFRARYRSVISYQRVNINASTIFRSRSSVLHSGNKIKN